MEFIEQRVQSALKEFGINVSQADLRTICSDRLTVEDCINHYLDFRYMYEVDGQDNSPYSFESRISNNRNVDDNLGINSSVSPNHNNFSNHSAQSPVSQQCCGASSQVPHMFQQRVVNDDSLQIQQEFNIDATAYLEPRDIDIDNVLKCSICMDDIPLRMIYSVECIAAHKYCVADVFRHISTSLLGDDSTNSHIPACPLANGVNGCNHLLTENEIKQVR